METKKQEIKIQLEKVIICPVWALSLCCQICSVSKFKWWVLCFMIFRCHWVFCILNANCMLIFPIAGILGVQRDGNFRHCKKVRVSTHVRNIATASSITDTSRLSIKLFMTSNWILMLWKAPRDAAATWLCQHKCTVMMVLWMFQCSLFEE